LSLLHRWRDKLRRHSGRLTKFGTVGVAGLIVDVGGFNILRYAGGQGPLYNQPLTAKVISTALGIMVSWVGNRYWTFRDHRRDAIRREFLLFLAVSLGGLAISLGVLAFTHYVLGLHTALDDNISANVIGLGLATAFRYWAMHKHVFTGTGGASASAAPSPAAEPALRR
jgi:putative flippase GtrA